MSVMRIDHQLPGNTNDNKNKRNGECVDEIIQGSLLLQVTTVHQSSTE